MCTFIYIFLILTHKKCMQVWTHSFFLLWKKKVNYYNYCNLKLIILEINQITACWAVFYLKNVFEIAYFFQNLEPRMLNFSTKFSIHFFLTQNLNATIIAGHRHTFYFKPSSFKSIIAAACTYIHIFIVYFLLCLLFLFFWNCYYCRYATTPSSLAWHKVEINYLKLTFIATQKQH